MLDCKKATFLIAKSQETELKWFEKLQLRMHLMACQYCQLFEQQSRFLNDNFSPIQNDNTSGNCLSEEKKKEIIQVINKGFKVADM